MDFLTLLGKTLLLRPYVFIFLAIALLTATWLMGRTRTTIFFLITWMTAFLCEFSSTRTGIPFGWYVYNDSTRGQELYLSNIPFMDSLSFTFLLFTSYCLALLLISPAQGRWGTLAIRDEPAVRTSGGVLVLAALFLMLLDVVIDPVALRGDRWFLGKIYDYPVPGIHFGVPIANYLGWAFVGFVALGLYQRVDRRLTPRPRQASSVARPLLFGCALYYGVLVFNLAVTFWIGEALIGTTGIMMYLPITAMVLLKMAGRLPGSATLV
jgi:putative membrane protein